MRIIAAADIHGVRAVYQWLVELTHTSGDVLVVAGDLFASDFASEQRKQAEKIVAVLRSSSVPVLYIMGNDDNVALNYSDELIQPIHGRRVAIGAYNFVGYQYTPPFVGDAFAKTDAEIEADLPVLEPLVDQWTVFVTHAPALGSLDLCYDENVGSRAIAQFLQRKPALAHIHGHIHERFGRDGNHFNVAAAGVCRAVLIELPLLVHTVLAYSPNLI
jgi:Icc-related predicted phosphoesterase